MSNTDHNTDDATPGGQTGRSPEHGVISNPEKPVDDPATPGGQTDSDASSAAAMSRRTFVAGLGATAAATTGATAQTTNTTNTTDGSTDGSTDDPTGPGTTVDYLATFAAGASTPTPVALVSGMGRLAAKSAILEDDVIDYVTQPDQSATETTLWQLMRSEKEGLRQHIDAMDNWLDQARSLAQIEARNAVAGAYERGASANEARQDAAQAIDAYYSRLQKTNWAYAAKLSVSVGYIVDVAVSADDIPDDFVGIMTRMNNTDKFTEAYNEDSYGVTDTDLPAVRQTKVSTISGESTQMPVAWAGIEKCNTKGCGMHGSFLQPTPGSGITIDPDGDETRTLDDGMEALAVVNVPVDNGPDLLSFSLPVGEIARIDQDLRDEAQAVRAQLPLRFVEDLFFALDNGEISPDDIRGTSGLANQISGTSDPAVSAHQMAIASMTGAARPDLESASSMTLKVDGWATLEAGNDDNPPQLTDRLEGRQIQGMLFADAPGAVEAGDTLTRVGTALDRLEDRDRLEGRAADDVAVSRDGVMVEASESGPSVTVTDLAGGSQSTIDLPGTEVGSPRPGMIRAITVGGGFAVVGIDNGIHIVDISAPGSATVVDSRPTPSGTQGGTRPIAAVTQAGVAPEDIEVSVAHDNKIFVWETDGWTRIEAATAAVSEVSRGQDIGAISTGDGVFYHAAHDSGDYGVLGSGPEPPTVYDARHVEIDRPEGVVDPLGDTNPSAPSLSGNPVRVYDADAGETITLAVGSITVQSTSAPDGSEVSGPVTFGDPDWASSDVEKYAEETEKAANATSEAVESDPTYVDGPLVGGGGDSGGSSGGLGLGLSAVELAGLGTLGALIAYVAGDRSD